MPKQKLLLVYLGNEQGSWGVIAYPRPTHYYIMPGILYCAQSLALDPWINERYEISWRFFNAAVQSRDEILTTVLDHGAAIVGFSVFCWNAADTFWLIKQLKLQSRESCVMAGGPEVSLTNAVEATAFFSENPGVDLLVFGEAEAKIASLVKAAVLRDTPLTGVTGYAFSPRLGGFAEFTKGFLESADTIPSIYPFALDIKRSVGCGLAMVYETGRGCPYRCIYCQFSHRNHRPFRFSATRVKQELAWLFGQGIECIHFADAVFDLDPDFAKDILDSCIRLNRSTSLFFYCSFYRLDDELARLFALSRAQICVGVQTTNPLVLAKINRTLSPRLFDDIRGILAQHNLNFYIDLIFGLPLDTVGSFGKSFADALELGPSFIMVFPLTLIKGTPLEQNAREYGMTVYSQKETDECGLMCGIEYRNIALSSEFSLHDLSDFDDLALALFYFYNRFRMSLSYLEKRCGPDTARLYQSIGKKTKSFLKKTGQSATNTTFVTGFEDEIREVFLSEAASAGAGNLECIAFKEIFKLDIFRILMNNTSQREKMFKTSTDKSLFPASAGHRALSDETRILRTAPGKAINCAFRLSDLRQLHVLKDSIIQSKETVYVSAPYSRWDILVFSLSPIEEFLLDIIPTDKPVKWRHLVQSAQRAGIAPGQRSSDQSAVCDALATLTDQDIIITV